jgi:hypothetical protein
MTTAATWRQQLVERHPELFIRAFRGVPVSRGYPPCSDGWRDIVTNVVEKVSAAAAGRPVRFTRMSEEHGSLRIHWAAEADLPKDAEVAIEEAVSLAEARSACTCQTCGAEGSLYSSGSWLLTACPDHARGVPVPVRSGLENVYLVRCRIGEAAGTIARRRYDRANDRFVEIEQSPCGIGE